MKFAKFLPLTSYFLLQTNHTTIILRLLRNMLPRYFDYAQYPHSVFNICGIQGSFIMLMFQGKCCNSTSQGFCSTCNNHSFLTNCNLPGRCRNDCRNPSGVVSFNISQYSIAEINRSFTSCFSSLVNRIWVSTGVSDSMPHNIFASPSSNSATLSRPDAMYCTR